MVNLPSVKRGKQAKLKQGRIKHIYKLSVGQFLNHYTDASVNDSPLMKS